MHVLVRPCLASNPCRLPSSYSVLASNRLDQGFITEAISNNPSGFALVVALVVIGYHDGLVDCDKASSTTELF